MKQKKRIISWILLLSWMFFIFYMSQQTGQVSSGQSGKIVLLLSKIGINISQDNISNITFIIRKLAHFSEYFILYILLFNVIKNYIHDKKIILYCIIGVIIYAISDEFHQYFIAGRSAQIKDVFIDSCGGITASIINNLFHKFKNTIKV
ncbi:MAG: VanZ family protein [Clostridium sp.]|nr:VanZ family protein [Clostridium sp.]